MRPWLFVLCLSNMPTCHLLHLQANRLAHAGQGRGGGYPHWQHYTLHSATSAAVMLEKVSTSAKFPKERASAYTLRQ